MMVSVGNFLFRTRNALFPLLYLTLFAGFQRVSDASVMMLILGSLIALVGQGIRILTVGLDYIVRGGRNKRVYANDLVQNGLFAHCRNPLYLGNLLMIVGFGVASNNPWYLAITLPLFFLAYACIIAAEEHYLLERFGDAYRHYCATTPRLMPRLRGLSQTLRTFSFNWRRVVVKEYSTISITLLVLVLLSGRVLNDSSDDWVLSAGLVGLILLACIGIRALKKSGRLSAKPAR
ncbi:methyltransferase family protein [Leclercia adecarboxylata]|uniref:methyltransferase family protein n=1 Tax=Leclercia adecarboxylata TaxID=83655 RepID=UPI003850686E